MQRNVLRSACLIAPSLAFRTRATRTRAGYATAKQPNRPFIVCQLRCTTMGLTTSPERTDWLQMLELGSVDLGAEGTGNRSAVWKVF